MHILVTGGLGYIGSHFIVRALELGFYITVVDNLSNSSLSVKNAIERICQKKFTFYKVDLRNLSLLHAVFRADSYDCVVHFAGLKSVEEASKNPLIYYENNVIGSWNLFQAMNRANVRKVIFSSSATVYGNSNVLPYTEEHCKLPFNPYGQTKSVVEEMLVDLCRSNENWTAISLRYFNPIGAHPSGRIGENSRNTPNNLMPYLTRVATGEYEALQVFGNDYLTIDGTGVRDYIHVMDLVDGHLSALCYMKQHSGFDAFNLGTGKGFSVLEVVNAFEKENSISIPLIFKPRRAGDLAAYWADPLKAKSQLGWEAKLHLFDMVRDAWNWQMQTALASRQKIYMD